VITSTNTGDATERIEVVLSTPEGATAQGCPVVTTRVYRCTNSAVAPGQQWALRVPLRVDANAWRRAPLFGTVTATAGILGVPTVQQQRSYEIVLPAGPARPNLALWAGDVVLASATTTAASLSVRVGNHGSVPATGRVELTTPDGVSLTTVSDRCRSFVRLDARRLRCELGRVAVNQPVALDFGLSIAPAVGQAGAPLEGSASASLTPPGGRTAQANTTFRLLVTQVVPPVTASPSAPAAPGVPGGGGGVVTASEQSTGMSATVVIAISVGFFTALTVFVLISLRWPSFTGRSG
jgi:hypothetical protein